MPVIITKKVKHNFKIKFVLINNIPEHLENNTLYISDIMNLTIHLCMCGCNHRVTNKLHEDYWRYRVNNGMVSMYPSIGNWYLHCRSHYWIYNSKIIWR